tara:strand:+ start:382 stop:711 length:330 start_codon:yes stop_codon:yes gene_type:complete
MYPVYNTGRVYTNANTSSAGSAGTSPILLNPNNKGVMVIPDQTAPAGEHDAQLTFMGADGERQLGHATGLAGGGLLVDGSAENLPYVIPITVHSIVNQIPSNAQVVELF